MNKKGFIASPILIAIIFGVTALGLGGYFVWQKNNQPISSTGLPNEVLSVNSFGKYISNEMGSIDKNLLPFSAEFVDKKIVLSATCELVCWDQNVDIDSIKQHGVYSADKRYALNFHGDGSGEGQLGLFDLRDKKAYQLSGHGLYISFVGVHWFSNSRFMVWGSYYSETGWKISHKFVEIYDLDKLIYSKYLSSDMEGGVIIPSGWKTYTDSKMGYQLSYPSDYLINHPNVFGAPISVLAIEHPKWNSETSKKNYDYVGFQIVVPDKPTDCKPIVRKDNYTDWSTQQVVINGVEYTKTGYSVKDTFSNSRIDLYNTYRLGNCYGLSSIISVGNTAWSTGQVPSIGEIVPVLNQILNTFSFVEHKTTSVPHGWKTYTHSELGYQISYPPDFVLTDLTTHPGFPGPIDISFPNSSSIYLLHDSLVIRKSSQTAEQCDRFNIGLEGELGKPVNINGYEFRTYSDGGDGSYAAELYSIFRNDGCFSIDLIASLPNDEGTLNPEKTFVVLRQILNTFTFVNPSWQPGDDIKISSDLKAILGNNSQKLLTMQDMLLSDKFISFAKANNFRLYNDPNNSSFLEITPLPQYAYMISSCLNCNTDLYSYEVSFIFNATDGVLRYFYGKNPRFSADRNLVMLRIGGDAEVTAWSENIYEVSTGKLIGNLYTRGSISDFAKATFNITSDTFVTFEFSPDSKYIIITPQVYDGNDYKPFPSKLRSDLDGKNLSRY